MNRGTLTSLNEIGQLLASEIMMNIYPNPINTDSKIDYYLPSKTLCSLNLLDINGNHIPVWLMK
jgi:hypothetical protein